jgi:hypothetical protein
MVFLLFLGSGSVYRIGSSVNKKHARLWPDAPLPALVAGAGLG